MRTLLSLVYLLLALVGCDLSPGNRIESKIDINGTVVLHTLVEHRPAGTELFQCLASATGRCHFLVYAGSCITGEDGRPEPGCVLRTLDRLTVDVGRPKTVSGLLPGYRICTSRDAMPSAPACAGP